MNCEICKHTISEREYCWNLIEFPYAEIGFDSMRLCDECYNKIKMLVERMIEKGENA